MRYFFPLLWLFSKIHLTFPQLQISPALQASFNVLDAFSIPLAALDSLEALMPLTPFAALTHAA